jgi:uncharacterized protein YkwD
MASFERTRIGPVAAAAREWRPGRFFPLYIAGVLAGIGLGIGLATMPSHSTTQHVATAAVLPASTIDDAPFVAPPSVTTGTNPAAVVELPLEFNAAFAGWYVPAAPALEAAPAPVAPAVAVPVQEAPAKPAPASAAQAAAPSAPQAAAPQAPAAPAAEAPAANAKPNFYVPSVSSGGATTMELGLFNLINAERAKEGLAPYTLESGLTRIARTRSQQMIDQNYFGHRDPYGYSMYVELLAYFGYTTYAWAGENLAMNNWPVATAGDEAIRGLMASPTHRANIMATDFTRIGVGEITAPDGRHFYSMIFLS